MSETPNSTLEGFVDHVDWHGIRGWAFDRATPDKALWLEVVIDDTPGVAFLANMRRQDLIDAGYGAGTFAFELRFPQPLDPLGAHKVDVRTRDGRESLPNMPAMLAAAPMASASERNKFEAAIAAEIAAASTGAALDETIGYLLRQIYKLLQSRADVQSGVAALHQFRLRWNDYLAGERVMPPQPDSRPWALIVDVDLPHYAAQLALVRAIQTLGYRVAVTSTQSLAQHGAVAEALSVMDVAVLGEPDYYTVEDILRRNRALFRAVVLNTPMVAAGYSVMTRLHQPRARLIAMLGDGEGEAARHDQPLMLSAALIAEFLIVESAALQQDLTQRLPGRRIDLINNAADEAEIGALMVQLLPRLRFNFADGQPNPPAVRDPS